VPAAGPSPGRLVGGLLEPFQARRFDLSDPADNKAQARHVAAQLGQRVRRRRRTLRCAQCCEPLRHPAQGRLEAANPEPSQGALDPVDNAGALANQALALAVRPLGILLLEGWDRGHAALTPFAAQPAEEGSARQLSVEPIGLRPPMLPPHGDTCCVDQMGFETARPRPPRQPETIPAGLENLPLARTGGHDDPADHATGLARLVAPAMQQPKQRRLRRRQFFSGWRFGKQRGRVTRLWG
jgi:hypothetical protein